MKNILARREVILFVILGGFFVSNALVAEIIGVKVFSVEKTLGLDLFQWNLLGTVRNLDLSAGLILWPIVFIMTDIINEYYGRRGVRILTWLTVGLISYAFIMIYGTMYTVPAEWWLSTGQKFGLENMQVGFKAIFTQTSGIILGSITAFAVSQFLDAFIFNRVKRVTGEKKVWLRATGSSFISQLIDTFIVGYIAFYLPGIWTLQQFLAVGIVGYTYKVGAAVILTPVIYLAHYLIDKFLGKERSDEMKKIALAG